MGVDDLVAAVRAVTTVASHPKIHAMTGIDYREYYIQNTAETLCRHAMDAQRAIWPAIEVDCAGPVLLPAVIEGWAILPDLVFGADLPDVDACWLVADDPTPDAARPTRRH